MDPEQFSDCFIGWMRSVHDMADGDVIASDEKILRGSYLRDERQVTIHMVNSSAYANQMVLGQLKTANKSSEITAIPELIDRDPLVYINAMGC
ncbi:ISAs1 family transposase [Alteromonas sp. KUL17]|uniref:ISAs1 family transposase n=1 Tax=Alteromonas sp. KUL17 TaxID=2480796 RepID=UPI00215B31D6|nr:ISAs1 family transposase [Alteromonas sp. KUL17]